MQWLRVLVGLAERNTGELLLVALAGLALLLVLCLLLMMRMRRVLRSHRRLMVGTDGKSLERLLLDHVDTVSAVLARADEVNRICEDVKQRLDGTVQHVGVVRFDAFEDVGGHLSFALALLDDRGNGVVLSSLHGRQETRLYAKPVRDGATEFALAEEEIEAVHQAGCEITTARQVRVPDLGRSTRR